MDFLASLNPRQRDAVEHTEGALLILAGAGSGKTRVITHRIAHLMTARRVPGWAILAVTFTNKASGEMRDRVRALLQKAAVQVEPNAAPKVSTFHSFCVRLLRRDGARLADLRHGFTPLSPSRQAVKRRPVLSGVDRKSTRLNSSHSRASRMPSSA